MIRIVSGYVASKDRSGSTDDSSVQAYVTVDQTTAIPLYAGDTGNDFARSDELPAVRSYLVRRYILLVFSL